MFNKNKSTNQPRRRRSENVTAGGANDSSERPSQFRINRTITGSSSRNVTSVSENNGTILSPRAHIHHLNRRRRRIVLRLGAVLVLSLSLFILLSQLIASTSVQMRSQTGVVDESMSKAYASSIDTYFSHHFLSRYYPALDPSALTAYMQTKHPEVEKAAITLTGEFGKAVAAIELRKPVARWIVNGETKYVDASGVVFSVLGYPSPEVTIIDQNSIALNRLDRKIIASNRFLVFVGQVVGTFSSNGETVRKAEIPLLTSRQLQLELKGVPYYIKMTIDRPAEEQVQDATRVMEYLTRKKIKANYIDVRVSGRAYYK